MANKFDFKEIKNAIRKEIKTLPKELAEQVKDDAVLNFYKESFDNKEWQPRKQPAEHPLMVDTGNLLSAVRDSVDKGRKLGPYIYQLNIVNDYGLFHNEGTPKLPQRQFIGIYPDLEKKLVKYINNKLDKHFEIK
jgi:phage gpG-like protein